MLYVSLGERCETAQALKEMEILSYDRRLPFNHMLSCDSFILDCLRSDFEVYIDSIFRDDLILENNDEIGLTFEVDGYFKFGHEFGKGTLITDEMKEEWQEKVKHRIRKFKSLREYNGNITMVRCSPNLSTFKEEVIPELENYLQRDLEFICIEKNFEDEDITEEMLVNMGMKNWYRNNIEFCKKEIVSQITKGLK
jgi:hypothetical protein